MIKVFDSLLGIPTPLLPSLLNLAEPLFDLSSVSGQFPFPNIENMPRNILLFMILVCGPLLSRCNQPEEIHCQSDAFVDMYMRQTRNQEGGLCILRPGPLNKKPIKVEGFLDCPTFAILTCEDGYDNFKKVSISERDSVPSVIQ